MINKIFTWIFIVVLLIMSVYNNVDIDKIKSTDNSEITTRMASTTIAMQGDIALLQAKTDQIISEIVVYSANGEVLKDQNGEFVTVSDYITTINNIKR